MGRHFDTLVELIKVAPESSRWLYPKEYYASLLAKTALFEFPMGAQEILPGTGKDQTQYNKYLGEYFDISHQYGKEFITPFDTTGIEDPDSVVILEPRSKGFRATLCYDSSSLVLLATADVTIDRPDENGKILVTTVPLYSLSYLEGVKLPNNTMCDNREGVNCAAQDFTTATISFLEEVVYIMDPANFIIEKETTQSRKLRERGKQHNKPAKTVMRPHYICLSEEDTRNFLRDTAKEPRPAHPVRGHWRSLLSPRYVNKQGQRIYIQQYFTGNGSIEGVGGWSYQVFVKEDPVTIHKYSR